MRSLLFVLLLAACTESPAPGPAGFSRTEKMDIPIGGTNQLDVLFVIDNSPAMAGKTARVAAHMTAFADVMASIFGGVPDLHVGVITTDLGTAGADSSSGTAIGTIGQGGCAGNGDRGALHRGTAEVTGNYLSDIPIETGRQKNYVGDLGPALVAMADVGSGGCAYARPLEATTRALALGHLDNTGFLRETAYLAVIHISASDDCSFSAASFLAGATTTDTTRCQGAGLVDAAALATALRSVKTDPTKILVAEVTVGNAPRLHAFADAFPNRRTETSLLDGYPSEPFVLIAELQKVAGGVSCWEAPLADLDPVAPGLQAECAAQLHTPTDDIVMKACAPGLDTPCFQIVEAPIDCPTTHLTTKFSHIDGYRGMGASVVIECLTEPRQ